MLPFLSVSASSIMRSSSDSGLSLSSFDRNHPAMAMPARIIQKISFQVADSIKCLSIRLMSGCASVCNASLTPTQPTMAKAAAQYHFTSILKTPLPYPGKGVFI
jgi:hypothetical protein